MTSKPIDGALQMLDRGYRVFPLQKNDRIPMRGMAWKTWDCSKENVHAFNETHPNCNWGVDCGASGLYVVDVDNKNGKNGSKSLKALERQEGTKLPPTLAVKTTTGGYHLYYKGKGRNTASTICDGVDTRGEGGYVVAPNSMINGKSYEYTGGHNAVVALPKWFSDYKPKRDSDGKIIATHIPSGERNHTLASFLGTLRGRGVGRETMMVAALSFNQEQFEVPLPEHEVVTTVESIARYEPSTAKASIAFSQAKDDFIFHRGSETQVQNIKPRRWVLGDRYISQYVTLIIAPGGVGKSMFTVTDAMAVVLGDNKLAGDTVHQQGGVWLHSTEDPTEEIERKIAGMCIEYGIEKSELTNLIYTSNREQELLVTQGEDKLGKVVPSEVNIRLIENTIRSENIKLMVIDPFIRAHNISENDNAKIDQVVQLINGIADRTNCAICLVHHCPKQSNSTSTFRGNMDMARGASSLVSAARVAYTLDTMNEDEAVKFGIPPQERRRYVRLDNAKSNLAPPPEYATWYEKKSVMLPHLEGCSGSQSVGAMIPIELKEYDFDAEKRDLATFLSNHIELGMYETVSTLAEKLVVSSEYTHLFGDKNTVRHIKATIQKYLKEPYECDGVLYSLEILEDEKGKPLIVRVSKGIM